LHVGAAGVRVTATPEDWLSADHPYGAAEGWVSGPWHGRLTLAGSETSPHEAGDLTGAVEASRRAVDAMARRLVAVPAEMARG